MKKILIYVLIVSFCCIFAGSAQAKIVVNEVLANEPGAFTTLEWIELHNTADTTVSLKGYSLWVDAPQVRITLPDEAVITPSGFYIICRRLYTSGTTHGFEEAWGDNSGVWGDGLLESQVPLPIERSFELINGSGTVRLFDTVGFEVDKLIWTESGQDGRSWEKPSPLSSIIAQSIDQSGGTPGFINSQTRASYDLSLGLLLIDYDNPFVTVTFGIINMGISTVTSATLSILTKSASGLFDDTLDFVTLPAYGVAQVGTIERTLNLPGDYINVAAQLSDDFRNNNNVLEFVLPGRDFPGIILSEFLANPTAGASAEWIEIQNVSTSAIDVSGWQVGDSRNLYTISDNALYLAPDEFLVLVRDSVAFISAFPNFTGSYFEPTGWGPLNDAGDTVRLVDMLGIQAGLIPYSEVFEDDHTWGRSENSDLGWGPSLSSGGTPGEMNEVAALQNSDEIMITVSPGIFSPDGDGRDETVTINIEAPFADDYEMRIYDKQGRVVYTFEIGSYLAPEYVWDGYSDAGKRLPIGIYIIYFEAVGVESAKQTVVIAR